MRAGLIVDNFAGGGGASTGIEAAIGRPIDVAINHDRAAVALHAANHPSTEHLCQNVWQVDPAEIAKRGPVALAWFSPDCKHFSKAKGGRPVQRNIRDLAWVVVLWAKRARPAVIMLENVEEFADWGPLVETTDGKMMPCPLRKGLTFRRWVRALEREGYRVEHRELRACNYGAPTIRKRLFLIARRDGLPIVWPAPTHAKGGAGGLNAWRSAAECIDWSIPCPSIFGRARPLADKTMARIAKGVCRYVINAAEPFIVPMTHAGDTRVHPIGEPLRTITTARRGELALVAAFLAQHNGGMVGHAAAAPLSTTTQRGTQQQLVTAILSHAYTSNSCGGNGRLDDPMTTVTAGGGHQALVQAFLLKYYGTAVGQSLREPAHTATTKARLGLVTVQGAEYAIVDIGMRMLTPRELFRAQGFPEDYIIDTEMDGAPLTKTAQIRLCGNSVCPPVAEALVRANLADQARVAA